MKEAKVSYKEVGGCTPEYSLSGNVTELTGYLDISCHLILDVNMEFARKTCFTEDGSMAKTPVALCY